MACPFFHPATPFSWEEWPNPPRMPLGDPYTGACSALRNDVPDERIRTCCNTGYARGTCPDFPGGDAPDVIRFGLVSRDRGVATIRYVIERNHHPFADGSLELAESGEAASAAAGDSVPPVSTLQRQAKAYLDSYLRRNV